MGGGPGARGEERGHLAEELAEASLEGLTDAVHDLCGSAAGTLQDVAGCGRDAVCVGSSACWFGAELQSITNTSSRLPLWLKRSRAT